MRTLPKCIIFHIILNNGIHSLLINLYVHQEETVYVRKSRTTKQHCPQFCHDSAIYGRWCSSIELHIQSYPTIAEIGRKSSDISNPTTSSITSSHPTTFVRGYA